MLLTQTDHKEALRNAREKLGMGDNQENKDAELAGAEAELNS
ncbi:hypothetical protein [Rickettsia bellii]|uniref:Uncharacterized protein n=1 Tax=Rickettsia bellii str. RML Mogi TaxID=1359194 RepID=A0A0F3QK35_RICBE|nr:hypothetical protein [Rickettsia bellii]KJV92521.1 hypothetical protein RBEMOGI_1153 [Rickettsia bellii str. RML Mogi]